MEVDKEQPSGNTMHALGAQGEAEELGGAEVDGTASGGGEDATTQRGEAEAHFGGAEDEGTDIQLTQQDTSGKTISMSLYLF